MFLVYDQALVCRSSCEILFFRIEFDEDEERRMWKQYHILDHRGFIYYINGNIRLQIVTDDFIYFYLMDK